MIRANVQSGRRVGVILARGDRQIAGGVARWTRGAELLVGAWHRAVGDRDNELAAGSLGIDIWRTKFVVYIVTAGLTTMVGALICLQKLRITHDAFRYRH